MTVLTVNAGSHSLHLANVDGDVISARLDRSDPPDSGEVAEAVDEFLGGHEPPEAVGHRLVHGGEVLRRATIVNDVIREALEPVADLAPLHVPVALRLLDWMRERLPGVPHVLCPDTAFHAALPEPAATYALPARWRSQWGLRRYGFHGLSYAWATRRAGHLLGCDASELQMVLAHLGGGSSVCAVNAGRSVDTSMGFTPLDGLPMATRSGAVDPGMLLWLLQSRKLSLDELVEGLYHHSGLLGLSAGRSVDTRDLVAAVKLDQGAALALDVFVHRARREIAAAATSLDRLDAIVFTGEIGWDQPEIRHGICSGLRQLGVAVPKRGNRTDDGPVSAYDTTVNVLVIEPREEFEIAAETVSALACG